MDALFSAGRVDVLKVLAGAPQRLLLAAQCLTRMPRLQINRSEILDLTKEMAVELAARVCFDRFVREHAFVAVTDGPSRAHLFSSSTHWRFSIPQDLKARLLASHAEVGECSRGLGAQVANPIGAGDTCTGVMAYCLACGMPVPEAYHWGLAAACASCLHPISSEFDVADMCRLHELIKLEGIDTWRL